MESAEGEVERGAVAVFSKSGMAGLDFDSEDVTL
jgi:hypothetical protein